MFYLGRLISAFFNQFFRWLFWNKTGQKVLFTIVIFAIAVCFIKLGEVSAVSEVEDINYRVQSYYDGVVGEFIQRLMRLYNDGNIGKGAIDTFVAQNIYLYYGNENGSSYNNAQPITNRYLYVARWSKQVNVLSSFQPSIYDYLGVTGYSMYLTNSNQISRQVLDGSRSLSSSTSSVDIYIPNFISTYQSPLWSDFCFYWVTDNSAAINQLLEEISDSLSNTTPDQESEDSVIVDSSATDSVDTSEIDGVFSSAFSSFANKFTYYDLSDADQWVITINGTRIVLKSDILYNMIKNTWFYPMLQLLWYYIFGHYAFVWLTNLIHKIKDGSILDGLEVNEVISKEML